MQPVMISIHYVDMKTGNEQFALGPRIHKNIDTWTPDSSFAPGPKSTLCWLAVLPVIRFEPIMPA